MGAYKELYGLKDENGKEYKLLLGEYIPNGIGYKPVEPELEFKVGDWVWIKQMKEGCLRVIGFGGDISGRFFTGKDSYLILNNTVSNENYYERSQNLRLATPIEVELYLKRIADKKYLGKRARDISDDFYMMESDEPLSNGNLTKYYHGCDAYYMNSGYTGICVYEKGKWAEIVEEKKKLPKTKKEFMKFIDDYCESDLKEDKFLDQYED